MSTEGMPSHIAASEETAAAWERGRDDADGAHAFSEAYGGLFETDGTRIDPPSLYADEDGPLAEAYADGYSVRAQDLTESK